MFFSGSSLLITVIVDQWSKCFLSKQKTRVKRFLLFWGVESNRKKNQDKKRVKPKKDSNVSGSEVRKGKESEKDEKRAKKRRRKVSEKFPVGKT